MDQDQKHPIVAGLIALVAVAVSVGVLLGIVVLVGTRVLGLGHVDTSDSSGGGASLYVPSPSPTQTASGPEVTLSSEPSQTSDASKPSKPTKSKSAEKEISLQASTTQVSPMQTFDISGVYPGGEGSLMRLQRQVNGKWVDFGIPDVAVTNGQFSTHVQTGRPGVQKFRMKDIDHDVTSNVVRVTIG